MDEEMAQKNGDKKKQFIVILYKKILILDSKNYIISINLNQSNKG